MSTDDTGASLAGLVVTHRRYIPFSHAHYAGDLVDGAYVLGLFGDVATELCIRTDGDEEQLLWGGLRLDLYRDAAASYWANLTGTQPSLFVLLPSSQVSAPSTLLSPHVSATHAEPMLGHL